ncbi:hypothetical protein FJM51_22405 [Amaricoccus solimangrovi]|uniref:Helicase ATP-binding domain-containing protein n=2 Tax=Amaricoccus solimangrovi TaxID=2589815 RepID=A0A501WJB5_9RHOB|nr:hypothetical protein FJM51_22405 [Amaricoccus solimangrovi]
MCSTAPRPLRPAAAAAPDRRHRARALGRKHRSGPARGRPARRALRLAGRGRGRAGSRAPRRGERRAARRPAGGPPCLGRAGNRSLRRDPRAVVAERIRLLLGAPSLPAEFTAEVAARLTAIEGEPVPAPKPMGLETRRGRDPVPVLRLFGLPGERHVIDGWSRRSEPVRAAALRLAFDYGGHLAPATRLHPGEAGQSAECAEVLAGSGIAFAGGAELLELGRRLNALTSGIPLPMPAALKAVPRPYQAIGYGWLAALTETGFGGLLADDMGLGKTLQALALLAKRHIEERASRPSLLIVPTNLARAWARQAAGFVPGLKVLVLQGPARKALFAEIDAAHLVVTTYPLLHRDHALLERDWELAILDEAQAVKNPASTAAKRICSIRARTRLALTGTPMENSLLDLWALFDWLVPGLLGDRKIFRAGIALPIERGDALAQARLNRRLRPFLLRRTKDEVARDLPAKTEITELVPLGPKQRPLYESVRMAMDTRVRAASPVPRSPSSTRCSGCGRPAAIRRS